jgi:hypothetical protein
MVSAKQSPSQNATEKAGAVTLYTVAGPFPSVGYVNNPSTLTYTLGTGTVTGTIVITPNDGGKRGTFLPPTLSLSSGTPRGSVKYIPAATGTVTISSTNNGGLTNPSGMAYTVMAQGLGTFPVNSWNDYSSMIPSLYKFRERYIRTRDPLPNMCYKQLEDALPPSYDLPMGENPMEGIENPPELLEADTSLVEESGDDIENSLEPETTPIEESGDGVESSPEPLEVETPPEEESPLLQEESESRVCLSPTKGSIGDEISLESDQELTEVTLVYVNGVPADFACVDNTHLIFVIPEGATSGTVKLTDSSGKVIVTVMLEVVSG